jgi:DNA repair exonuclease SbcCD nuclease subunit
MRFIHCSDLHIGAPFKGISETNPVLGDLLYQSTYKAFDNIVSLALKQNVDCVVIAGDIYDSEDKSLKAQLQFRNGLERLSESGIPSFIAYGNHDPLSGWSATLKWPKQAYVFTGNEVGCYPVVKEGKTVGLIYGISFANREIYENLAARFLTSRENVPKIGVLHTNVGNNTRHEPYAPCCLEDLAKAGIDYWALGHIHQHDILKPSNPAVVYSGCSQSRNPHEIGPKGCCMVTLNPGTNPVIEFLPSDAVRYQMDTVDVSECISIDDVIQSIADKCKIISTRLDGRSSVIRITVEGRTNLHSDIHKSDFTELLESVRNQLTTEAPLIWLDQLSVKTSGLYDLNLLRKGDDFVADIISACDAIRDPQSPSRNELRVLFQPLLAKLQKHMENVSEDELNGIIKEARGQLLDILVKES